MTTSELIKQLQESLKEHGDLRVRINCRITTGKKDKVKQYWDLIDPGDVYSPKSEFTIIDALD